MVHQVCVLAGQLRATGAYAAGDNFTLADIVLGLSVNRWVMTPMQRSEYSAVALYYQRLYAPRLCQYCGNGVP